ncbi:hypothetical protein WMH42_13645, partial [Staphylococcus aureus]
GYSDNIFVKLFISEIVHTEDSFLLKLYYKFNFATEPFMLLSDEEEWGKLHRNSRTKYKNLIKEISPVDLTDLMKSTLKANEKQLQKQIDFWQHEFKFWK